MFCTKCGKQLPENGVCDCESAKVNEQPAQTQASQPPVQPQASQAPKQAPTLYFNVPKFTVDKIVTLASTALVFLLHFISWYSASVYGVNVGSFGPYGGFFTTDLSDISVILAVAKVFLIINVFVFLARIAFEFIDLKKLFPTASFDLIKLLNLAFYGLLALSLLVGLIGIISTKGVGFGAGWWLTLIFGAIGGALNLVPNLLSKLVAMAKGAVSATSAPQQPQQ